MLQACLLHDRPVWIGDALQILARHRFATARQLAGRLDLDMGEVRATCVELVRDGALRELRQTTLATRDAQAPAYALTPAGLALIEPDRDRLRPRATRTLRSAFSLAHELVVNEGALALEALHARGTITLLSWQTARERIGDVAFLAEKGGILRVPLVADALAVLEVGGQRYGLLIEIDMGTVSTTTMRRKYQGYVHWWAEGGPARRFGLSATRVLTIAPRGRRLARLRTLAVETLDGRGSGLLWFAPHEFLDVAAPERFLGPRVFVGKAGEDEPRPLFAL